MSRYRGVCAAKSSVSQWTGRYSNLLRRLGAAFNFLGGPPEAVYRLALEDRIELVTSPPLLAELGRVLAEKFEWETSRVEEAVAQVAETATIVSPDKGARVVEEDPADNRVIEAAAAGAAEGIVSGDGHLLRLGSWRGIRIVKADCPLIRV